MNIAYSDIRLNGTLFSKQHLLQRCNDTIWLAGLDDELKQVYLFISEWLNESDTIMVQTSGSTGNPKTISLRKQHMVNSALLTQNFFRLNKDSTALLCLPVKYIAGKMMLVRAFVAGFNLLTTSPTANPFVHLNHKIDFTALTPYQLYHSMNDIKRLKIKQIIIGGGDISSKLEKTVRAIRTKIFATYGMTETSSHVALRKVNGDDASDIYFAIEGISFKQDKRNCLVIHAPMLSDQQIVTNDIVELIDETHFRWLGRYDNVINTGGIKVFPESVEKKISGIIDRPFFIGSEKDLMLSERVVMIVEGNFIPHEEEQLLMSRLKEKLVLYEMPKKIMYIDKFLYSESGKILRKKTLQE